MMGGSSQRNSVNGPAWGQNSFLPGMVASAGDAATTGAGSQHLVAGADAADAAPPVDPVAALRKQAARSASALLLQRVGRGLAVRNDRLWTSIGVPRDPYLYTLALAAAEWDAQADSGTLPGPWSASLDLLALVFAARNVGTAATRKRSDSSARTRAATATTARWKRTKTAASC